MEITRGKNNKSDNYNNNNKDNTMTKSELRSLIKEEIKKVLSEKTFAAKNEVSVTGEFNDMDFAGPAKKDAKAYLKTPEGAKAIQIFKKLVSQPFDAGALTKAIKAAKFTKTNHFRVAAAKGGLELDTLNVDNDGSGDFGVENSNYEDQGAAIAFFNNKFDRVG